MQATQARVLAPEHDDVQMSQPLVLVPSPAVLPVVPAPNAETVKRVVDVAVSAVALLVLAPLFALVALAIRLDSRGSVFYRQERVGRNGGVFSMLKFRTMVDGAHERRYELLHLNEAADGLFKITRDPRVTRVGRVLRRAHLDELPQLMNVLAGRMSLVGPRPLVPEEDALVPAHLRDRLAVRPGMTGAWQVTGDHGLGLTRMAELDRDYIARWSLATDLRVLAATALLVVRRAGK